MRDRNSLRLYTHNYAGPGWYFVTIKTYNSEYLFGDVIDKKMELNEFGKIVHEEWAKTPKIRKNIELGEFIVMPNHLHGLIHIKYKIDNSRGVLQYAPTVGSNREFHSPSHTLGAIIRGFKSAATKRINIYKGTPGHPVWQRNYNDRVIRGKKELINKKKYILNNPLLWENKQIM
ncbi:MAG: transposase [Candidatus Marinimicrobia bacterium]|nr:transposase [Candidatus Neomarinimicrobiota bacterium]